MTSPLLSGPLNHIPLPHDNAISRHHNNISWYAPISPWIKDHTRGTLPLTIYPKTDYSWWKILRPSRRLASSCNSPRHNDPIVPYGYPPRGIPSSEKGEKPYKGLWGAYKGTLADHKIFRLFPDAVGWIVSAGCKGKTRTTDNKGANSFWSLPLGVGLWFLITCLPFLLWYMFLALVWLFHFPSYGYIWCGPLTPMFPLFHISMEAAQRLCMTHPLFPWHYVPFVSDWSLFPRNLSPLFYSWCH